MQAKCEVVGWLLDTDTAQMLVREESGEISLHSADPQSTLGHQAIQTGRFHKDDLSFDNLLLEV